MVAVFDLRHQPKLDLYVGFFVRQNLIRFMVWIRALKTLRPITDYALHVLLLIGIFSEAYLWLRNTVKVDSRASRLDVYRVPPLVGAYPALNRLISMFRHLRTARSAAIAQPMNPLNWLCRYGPRAGILLCYRVCHHADEYAGIR
jgi:hypothetical protein